MLTIGRQNRSELYDLFADRSPPLVPSERCLEITERVDHQGRVLIPLDESQIPGLLDQLRDHGVESVAICMLFSFLRPEHEARLSDALQQAGFEVSSSSQCFPNFVNTSEHDRPQRLCHAAGQELPSTPGEWVKPDSAEDHAI